MKKLLRTCLGLASIIVLASTLSSAHAQSGPSKETMRAVNAVNTGSKAFTIQNTIADAALCGPPTKVITHMSTEVDATGNAFVSALILRNGSAVNMSSVIVCGFNTDGSFIGGSQVQVGGNGRVFATTAANSSPSLQQVLGNANLGNKAFQIWMKNVSGTIYTEYGYVGNSGQFLSFTPLIAETYSSSSSWLPNHAGADSTYNTVLYLSNASSTTATNFTVELRNNDGVIVVGGTLGPVPPRGRFTYALRSDLLAQNVPGFYSLYVIPTANVSWSAGRVIVYPTTGVGGIGVSVMPMY